MNPLISAEELLAQGPFVNDLRLLDARFRLQDPASAQRLYEEGHLPGAIRVDLDRDLSGTKGPLTSRHPFPSREALVSLFSALGISKGTTVVAYDDVDHAGAGRLWFLLRWMGHENVRVLHGGLKAWVAAGGPLDKGTSPKAEAAKFEERHSLVTTVDRGALAGLLVDVRARERYLGDVEPLDPIAGHIPGAKNLPYASLLGPDGKFLDEAELKAKMRSVGEAPTFYCGSGVTATVAMLAAEFLGKKAQLYPGSFSEWSRQPGAKVEKGESP